MKFRDLIGKLKTPKDILTFCLENDLWIPSKLSMEISLKWLLAGLGIFTIIYFNFYFYLYNILF